ncbi:hypothetical protein F5Y13DRAFT_205965 [Hypoxylon sp. FL1857]|nr:hypothetical protein F5Y13DRAFT_205965 [Hypoxylon sp. FL1857]
MDAAGLAIAVTGCVLKLVAFSVDFVVDVKQVYQKGATDRNRDLAIVANNIQDAAKTLEGQLDDFSKQGQEGSMDPAEKDIRALATRATAIGNELASRLKKVHADTKSKQKALETVIRGMWDAEEIEMMEKQLNGIRNEIQLRLLIDIRRLIQESHSDEYHHMVLALERTAHSLMDSKKDSGTVMELLSQINGSIKDLQQSINATPAADERSTGLAREGLTKEQFMRVQRKAEDYILGWLWYPSIHDRKESIEEAHSETLNWIYDDPKAGDKSCTWDSFSSFLTSEASMYWITGKPGSGKSTLMKFITEQPRTAELLQLWAGDKEVLFASFYFFYKGSNEQKTELGLLRSLLYWILSRRKVLIPVVFKERFTAVFERIRYNELEGISYNELKGIKYDEPTLPEARRALRHLFREIPHLCFFLTIDGLDEFDPGVSLTHVTSLIELTKMLGIFENVKIVVSSRQLPEFEQGFEACPHLRIHELTRRDIHHYATEKLGSHQYMNKLIRRDPVNSRALIESVTTMSCGVFLWVRVVTQSLLQGLTNRDTIYDLQQRLEGLPSDLLDLYKVMLERVEQRYRNQTCQLLQLVYHGILEDPEQLSALGLWFAERADHNMVVQTKTKAINDEVAEDRVDEIESRLKSRCLGLVEVQPGPKSIYNGKERCGVDENLTRAMVVFSHRTVREFLRSSIWEEFTKMHCHPSFNAQESLLRSAILLIKTYRPRGKNDWCVISSLINAVRMRARNLEGKNEAADPELLQEFDSAVAINLATHSDYVRDVGDKDGTTISHWSKYFFREYHGLYKIMPPELIYRYPREDTQPSFLSFAIKSGLENYVAKQVKIHGPDILVKPGVPLLGHALCPNDTVVETRIGVVKALLDSGSDPQQTFEGMSLWAWFWHMLFYRFGIETQMTYSCPQWVLNVGEKGIFPIMRLMLIAGAEPNVLIPWMSYPDKAGKGKWDYCTPLVAMARLREFLLDDEFITEKHHSILGYDNRIRRKRLDDLVVEIEKVIKLLKERGGTRKRMECEKYPPFEMAKTAFDTIKNRSAWVKKSFTYMKTIVKG